MPRISAKRKAISAANRQNVLKRWRKDEVGEHVEQQVGGPDESLPGTSASPAFPRPTTQSAATFRHSLLPPEYREAPEVSENGGLFSISLLRLSAVLNLVSCDECGIKGTWKVIPSYFDCTIEVKVRTKMRASIPNSGYTRVRPSLLA